MFRVSPLTVPSCVAVWQVAAVAHRFCGGESTGGAGESIGGSSGPSGGGLLASGSRSPPADVPALAHAVRNTAGSQRSTIGRDATTWLLPPTFDFWSRPDPQEY